MSIPDLDFMTQTELTAFISEHRELTPEKAYAMIGHNYPEGDTLFYGATLVAYAIAKKEAVKNRLARKIILARQHEQTCEVLYHKLSPEMRW